MLTAKKLRGNWGTVLLPVNDDDSFDYGRLSAEIDYLIAAKLDGIYTNGTAGELHNQTEAEFDCIQKILADKCHNSGMRFQIGASHPFPVVALKRIERLRRLNPDAFQVILPDWVPLNSEEQVIFLKKMAAAAEGIPLVLYNPPHAKRVLTPRDIELLINKVPELIGIKVAGGDENWYKQMRAYSSKIAIFIPGHFLATGVEQKVAAGSYSNVACLSPEGSQQWWLLMHADLDEALLVQTRILEFFEEYIVPFLRAGYCNPALDKFLASVGGWCGIGTRLRWPYRWISEKEVLPIRKKAKKLLPSFILK